jgi:signal transduction histidine kinase
VRAAAEKDGSGTLREDFRVVHPDGSVRWLAITAQMTVDTAPRAARRLVGMLADITERKSIEEALREREERLRDGDRRKDEFLAILAHELRNPLGPIRTGLELIRLAGDDSEAIERVRTMMERQVSHMVRLIDDLLDVSRITSGKIRLQRQPTLLATMVQTAIDANRAALAERRIEFHSSLPDVPVMLDVDPTRFVQIVSNLLNNAVKFTSASGRIEVVARIEPPSLRLTVADSGIGISRELLPRVFDLFAQGEESASSQVGLGIGLALARRLVEMHGGTIEAESPGPGLGSVFTIRLPLSKARVESTPLKPSIPSAKLRRRVVVIDDNVDAADSLKMFVTALGSECRVAYDGERGLQQVVQFRPQLILLDIGMPRVDGYETCRRIRKQLGASVVIVAISGWGQDRDKLAARKAGFDAHLTKPVDPIVLKGLLAEADGA